MSDSRRAWAGALFSAAAPPSARGESYRPLFAEALEGLRKALEEPAFQAALEDPVTPRSKRIEILSSALAASAPAEARRIFSALMSLIVAKDRIPLLPAIAGAYRELLDAEEGRVHLEIEAAFEPSPALVEELAEAWKRSSGAKTVRTSLRLSPALIGGYRLRSGSIRYDHSIAGRVERLRHHLSRSSGTGGAQG